MKTQTIQDNIFRKMKIKSRNLIILLLIMMFGVQLFCNAEMTSSNYIIQSDSFNVGGSNQASNNYGMSDTIGENASGLLTSDDYEIAAGYQSMLGDLSALVPVPEPPSSETGAVVIIADTVFPEILNIEITEITENSAKLSWQTNEFCIPQINYSESLTYEKTYIGESFSMKNSVYLESLLSDTIYHFEIVAIDRTGNRTSSGDQTFKTLSLTDVIPPTNITDFEAMAGDRQATLTWQNPAKPDFKGVRIMRKEEFYSSDPEDGLRVYDSSEDSFTDTDLTNGIRYYYTAFTYDQSGNYSSGAVVSVVPFYEVIPEIPPEIPSEAPPEEIPLEIEKLVIEDFNFIQEDKRINIKKGNIELKENIPLVISIPYEKVPEALKTIMITLEKNNKSFSFLLRINQDKTFYQATIMPPEAGAYPMTLTILDYKNQSLKRIKGQLEIIQLSVAWYKSIWANPYLVLIVLSASIICVLFIKKKRKKLASLSSQQIS